MWWKEATRRWPTKSNGLAMYEECTLDRAGRPVLSPHVLPHGADVLQSELDILERGLTADDRKAAPLRFLVTACESLFATDATGGRIRELHPWKLKP